MEMAESLTVDESLEKLRFFFAETLLLGALDLIDRDSGKYPESWLCSY